MNYAVNFLKACKWFALRIRYRSVFSHGATAVICLLWLTSFVLAQQSVAQPILRIETGMHTAPIRRISIDRDNRYLVTASDDKTARVWELSSGKLLRVLRPPLGAGSEGKLYSVAFSPDGRTVAVSGWTSPDGLNNSIYLFDCDSGQMLRRIAGLPNLISHLTYSPDGSCLAATFVRQNGVHVYETSGYAQLFIDTDYSNQSYGADFDASGRLVVSCFDGFVRLYAPMADKRSFRLVTKRKVEGAARPFSVKFSPDGSKIAVGFIDSTRVVVVSGRDLSLLFAPDTTGVNNGSLNSVTWSADGQTLFAGGRYSKSGQCQVRSWSEGGRGKWREVAAASSTITQMLSTRDGGVVFGAGDPAFGRVDASGNRTLFVMAAIADYRGLLENFLLSLDGTRLQFGYEYGGKSPARFSLGARQLLTDINLASTAGLAAPLTSGIAVTDWENSDTPKISGQALKLDQYEASYGLAIASNKSGFLLGTDCCLRLFDGTGKEVWKVVIPSVAWSVNISGDGRLAVAAFGDGTIRWYRMSDGKELLAFFPHNDRKRWVLWTPSGYYDASPGGEDLIGWHVNRGNDSAADFYPASRFRNTAYRPDVIDLVLKTLDESVALSQANEAIGRRQQQLNIAQSLPPVISILSPADGGEVATSEITLRYLVRSPSGVEITGIKALVDGRPVSINKGQSSQTPVQADKILQLQISIPQKDCDISLIAENQYAFSEPAIAHLKWRGQQLIDELKPRLYVLAIGVSRYQHADIRKLNFAAKDARDFSEALTRQKGGLYRDVMVKVLTDEQATRDAILGGLDWIERQTTQRDVAMVFLSGHGVNDRIGRYFFSNSQCRPG